MNGVEMGQQRKNDNMAEEICRHEEDLSRFGLDIQQEFTTHCDILLILPSLFMERICADTILINLPWEGMILEMNNHLVMLETT